MARPVIVGIGEVLWDMLPGGKQLGGAPANFAYHANALDAEGVVASRVGDDKLGGEALRRLESLGLGVSYVSTDRDRATGRVDVRLDPNGVPDYVIHDAVAWDFIPLDDRLLDLADGAEAVCFGTLAQRSAVSRETIRAFVRATRARCLRVLDINLRQKYFDGPTIRESLRYASVLKLNDSELPVVARLLGLEGGRREVIDGLLAAYPLQVIAFTRGPEGSVLYAHGRTSDHPGLRAEVVDTVGAGDAFTAALVVGLLAGHDLDRINAFANRIASYVCSQPGATPPIPGELTDWT